MRTVITLELHERGVLVLDGRPARALAPGRHVVWSLMSVDVVRYDTRGLVIDMPVEHQVLFEAAELRRVTVGDHERALVKRRGRPMRWLLAGDHLVWNVDRIEKVREDGTKLSVPGVEVVWIDVGAIATAPLKDEVRALVPAGDYTEVTVPAGSVGLRHVDGAFDAELGPGRHGAWTTRCKVTFVVLDLRERVVAVSGQDVMTKDKVTIRLNAALTCKVVDARRLAQVARNADEVLYLAMQLALREAVARHGLEELLAQRDLLADAVKGALAARAAALGLELVDFGVKDLILPGEMKTLLNRVLEAHKAAEANVIFRREETAAARSMAQTAKVLADNPLLIRLKELEAYKDLAGKVGTVHLVLGAEGLQKLELKAPG